MWQDVEFFTYRCGTRRSELRRLLSLAAWAQKHALTTKSLAISARVPPDCQPAALKAVAQAALAAGEALESLSLTTNRGFWCSSWLRKLQQLRCLHLSSMEGGLSLHNDLSALSQLTRLVLEARHGVALQEQVRLPHSIQQVQLSCIRDTLPPPLGQLTRLRSLAVRRGLVSEGVLLTEYDCLDHLTGLTSLSLEQQEDDSWLPPPELLRLTGLRHLSIAGNDATRWPLHGSDELFSLMLLRMTHLTSLDVSCCGLEQLPPVLLYRAPARYVNSVEDEGSSQPPVGPRLRRLLAHGNQLEAFEAGEEGEESSLLTFPSSLQQLSIDWQLLEHLSPQAASAGHQLQQTPCLVWPRHCRQLALVGREGIDASRLAALPALMPALRHVLLEKHGLEVLWRQGLGGSRGSSSSQWLPTSNIAAATTGAGDWQLVGGRWRPTRLPGQRRQHHQSPGQQDETQQNVLLLLRQAGVEVLEVVQSEIPGVLDQLAEQQGVASPEQFRG